MPPGDSGPKLLRYNSLWVSPAQAFLILHRAETSHFSCALSELLTHGILVEKKILWPARKKNFPLVLLTASLVILKEGKSHSTFSFMPQECERVKWAPRTLWLIITLKMSGWQMAIENTHNHADSCLHMCHMWSSNWIKRTTEATSKSFQRIWNCDPLSLIFLYPGSSIDKIYPAHACFHNAVKYKYFS